MDATDKAVQAGAEEQGNLRPGHSTQRVCGRAWHMRIGRYGRAFFPAPGPLLAVVLWLRGWRPFESMCVSRGRWWSKPSPNTRDISLP